MQAAMVHSANKIGHEEGQRGYSGTINFTITNGTNDNLVSWKKRPDPPSGVPGSSLTLAGLREVDASWGTTQSFGKYSFDTLSHV